MDLLGVDPYAPWTFDDRGATKRGRNDTAIRIAGRELSMGIPIRDIRTRGRDWAFRCEPPLVLPEYNIDEVIDNAIKMGLKNGDEDVFRALEEDPDEMRRFVRLFHEAKKPQPDIGSANSAGHCNTYPDASGTAGQDVARGTSGDGDGPVKKYAIWGDDIGIAAETDRIHEFHSLENAPRALFKATNCIVFDRLLGTDKFKEYGIRGYLEGECTIPKKIRAGSPILAAPDGRLYEGEEVAA
ncbi:MAG: hypothetical protein LBT40_04685 [Deltaproteobacteria bacterium]|jgi:hypothetical protein|nr:hypothetical protein [Deltaproteobacteria bacterium]